MDVEVKKVFWSAVQLDEAVLNKVTAGPTASLTVRIPTENILPVRRQFIQDLVKAQVVVTTRGLLGTSHIDFVAAMASQPVDRKTLVAEDLHAKGFMLELDTAFRQRQAGDVTGAMATINKVIAAASAAGYVEVHFNAALQRGDLEWVQTMKSALPQAQAAQEKLLNAEELCRIARRKPKHLHLAAQMLRKAAELKDNQHTDELGSTPQTRHRPALGGSTLDATSAEPPRCPPKIPAVPPVRASHRKLPLSLGDLTTYRANRHRDRNTGHVIREMWAGGRRARIPPVRL